MMSSLFKILLTALIVRQRQRTQASSQARADTDPDQSHAVFRTMEAVRGSGTTADAKQIGDVQMTSVYNPGHGP
jgi:hypothetical protein